jgi:uncharacterized protein YegP (UPF0339 family)
MNAKYQIYRDVSGKYRFRLRAENNKIVAVSEAYENHSGCLNGVRSVKANCDSGIEDLTTESERISNPKYQIIFDKACGYRFHLNARNGEIIAASEGYETKEGCMNGIKAVQASCDSEIDDLTVAVPVASSEPVMEKAESMTAAIPVAPSEPIMEKAEATAAGIPSVPAASGEPMMEKPEVTSPAMPEIDEAPVCEDKELKLHLDDLPATVAKGEIVYFKGKISENCQGKGMIPVSIREHDRSFFFDKILARGYAQEDGSFNIGWRATTFDFWDNKGEIYAQYDRSEKPKHVRSEFKNIVVK